MMRNVWAAVVCVCGVSVAVARPDFDLVPDAAGGQLSWSCHTVPLSADALFLAGDPIAEDTAAKALSLGLHWNTTPDTATGGCLAINYYWRIEQAGLVAPRYRVTVERVGQGEVIFVLVPQSVNDAVLRSPRCRLAKAFVRNSGDLAGQRLRIDAQALRGTETEPKRVKP